MALFKNIILIYICFPNIISSVRINVQKYTRSTDLNDKASKDFVTAFSSVEQSVVQCVLQCVLTPNCESVFYSFSSCKGYPFVYSSLSPDLISMPGARFFNGDNVTHLNSNPTTKIPMVESCAALNSLGYVWNDTGGKCCHYQNIKVNILDSRKRCMREAHNSRLLLVDSDETFNFAKDVIDKCGFSSIYLQGTRSGANFVDDDGKVINNFRWNDGEPKTDNYLRTSRRTNLQKTSSGLAYFNSVCCLY